jgi:hypothetical protein
MSLQSLQRWISPPSAPAAAGQTEGPRRQQGQGSWLRNWRWVGSTQFDDWAAEVDSRQQAAFVHTWRGEHDELVQTERLKGRRVMSNTICKHGGRLVDESHVQIEARPKIIVVMEPKYVEATFASAGMLTEK